YNRLYVMEIHHLRLDPAIAARDGCCHLPSPHAATRLPYTTLFRSTREGFPVRSEIGRRSAVEVVAEEHPCRRRSAGVRSACERRLRIGRSCTRTACLRSVAIPARRRSGKAVTEALLEADAGKRGGN